MRDHEIIELYWARNESAITATAEKYGNYCHTIAYKSYGIVGAIFAEYLGSVSAAASKNPFLLFY